MASKRPSQPADALRVAIRVADSLEADLRAALERDGFTVNSEGDLQTHIADKDCPLVVYEVREETESLARQLLSDARTTTLIFIGPTGSEVAGQRENVRELSIDVSVAEIVRLCREFARGRAQEDWGSPPVSQPSMPFNVLPRVSEAPASKHSMPAPLLPSSVPPSSRPASSRRKPTLPPSLVAFPDDNKANLSSEISAELSKILSEAETRVRRGLVPRAAAVEEAPNEVVLSLSGEVLAALEDPIGDYDSVSAPPTDNSSRSLRPPSTPPSARGATLFEPNDMEATGGQDSQVPASETGTDSDAVGAHTPPPAPSSRAVDVPPQSRRPLWSGGPTSAGDAPPSLDEPSRLPSRPAAISGTDGRSLTGASHPTRASHPIPSTPRPPASRQSETTSALDGFGTAPPAVAVDPLPYFDSRRTSVSQGDEVEQRPPDYPDSVPAPSAPEPTTAPPPSRQSDERITVRPLRGISPLPPAPALPRGAWLDAAVQREVAEDKSESITSRPPFTSPSPSSRPPPREHPTAKPPPVATTSHEFAAEMPLRRGDSASILASAIRTRLTGALVFETAGIVRRVVLRDGDFVTAASGARDESLLSFLVQQGTMPAQVEAELGHKIPNLGRHAGAALVAAGHLAQDQLWPTLRAHAEFVTGRVLQLDAGTAGFEQDVPARLRAEPAVFGGATGSEVFIEMLRRVLEPSEALRRLGGPRAELAHSVSFELIDECALSPPERQSIDALQRISVGEALADTPTAEFACVLYALTLLQILKTVSRATRQEQAAKASFDRLDDEALRQAVVTRRKLIDEGDYFAILGVPRHSTGYDIRRAFVELKRQLDPSRALTPQTLDLAEDLELIIEVLNEAYEILSDQVRRDRYRRAIESVPA